jgi:uncharacterized membrane protein
VVILAHVSSLAIIILLTLSFDTEIPTFAEWIWAGFAGLGGGIGLLILYMSLASGKMAVTAPISALIAASLPVIFAMMTDGLPDLITGLGLLFAIFAIALLSSGEIKNLFQTQLWQPVIAGIAFGIFFICLHQASSKSVFYPLISVRIVSITSISMYAFFTHQVVWPSKGTKRMIIASGMLDIIGNIAFALAANLGRVDIAAVLGSLYPGATVLLARFFNQERLGRNQIAGIFVAMIALILISS